MEQIINVNNLDVKVLDYMKSNYSISGFQKKKNSQTRSLIPMFSFSKFNIQKYKLKIYVRNFHSVHIIFADCAGAQNYICNKTPVLHYINIELLKYYRTLLGIQSLQESTLWKVQSFTLTAILGIIPPKFFQFSKKRSKKLRTILFLY